MSDGKDGDKGSFESRMTAARARQGLDPIEVDPAKAGSGTSALGVGLRVGTEMVSALAVGAALGYALDRWLHTSPFLLSLFVLMGGAAGVANVWRVLTVGKPKG